MEIKNILQSDDVKDTENTFIYMPSSSEKKRAIMMYLFFGIMVSITKKDMNSFEYYHLKQSSGWRILFLLVLVFDVVLLFLPIIKYLWIIPLLILVVAWVINVKQARDWKYFIDKKESFLALFSWIGNRFIELFEISVNIPKNVWEDSDKDILPDQLPQNDIISENINNSEKSDIEMDLDKK